MNPVGFDNTMLSLLLNPKGKLPVDAGGRPVSAAVRRAEYLVETLGKTKRRIIVPMPVVAELLTAIGSESQKWLEIVARSRLFELAPFDYISAIELSILNRETFYQEDRKGKLDSYQKIKTDRQIIAILRTRNVLQLYTDDKGLANRALICGITPIATPELPTPEVERQLNIEFQAQDEPLLSIQGNPTDDEDP